MNLREMLEQEVGAWRVLGCPALLQRFVLKHGVEFQGAKRPKGVRQGMPKMCFRNAARRAIDGHGDYYEGYVFRHGLPMPILHAWTVEDGQVVDCTLPDPEDCTYFGMRFGGGVLETELVRNGVYGLLDPGMINVKLLRTIDDALVTEVLAVMKEQRHG